MSGVGFSACTQVSAAQCPLPLNELSLNYVEGYFGKKRAHELLADSRLYSKYGVFPPTISKVAFWQLCVDSILALGDEAHGLTKRPVPIWSFATVFTAINQMDTLGDGLQRLVELTPLLPADIVARLSRGHEAIDLHFAYSSNVIVTPTLERYLECFTLVFHCALLWIAARPVTPIHIRLSNLLDDMDGSLLAGISAAHSRKGTGVTLTYNRADMTVALGSRKYQAWAAHETTTFLQLLANVDQEKPIGTCATAGRLRELLTRSSPDQEEAARALNLSPATLRRRLKQGGTSFREVSKDVRRERLIALLGTKEGLDDIAVELGFSDRRSLWRTCNDWLGMSPSAWRRRKN